MLEVLLEEDNDGFDSRKEKEGRGERGQDRTEHHWRRDLGPALIENGCRVEAVSKCDGQARPAMVCIEPDKCVRASVAIGGRYVNH